MTDLTEEKPEKSNKKLYLILIGLLLLVNLIGFFFLMKKNKENSSLETKYTQVNSDYANTMAELNATKLELEQKKGVNAQLDSLIADQEKQLDVQKAEIETLLKKGTLTSTEISKAKKLIEELKAKNQEMVDQVNKLTEENTGLKTEKVTLETSLQKEKETTQELTVQKTKLEEDRKVLAKKSLLGSLLKTTNITATGIKVKDSGKESETNKIKKMNKLRLSYETGDNSVIDAGKVSHYIRIIGPEGTTITSSESGVLKSADGTDVQYTKKIDVDYMNTNKNVKVYWDGNSYSPGSYIAEVYQSGYKIGSTTFELE